MADIKFNIIDADGEDLKIGENIRYINYEITGGYHTLGKINFVGSQEINDESISFNIFPNPSNDIFLLEANANTTLTIHNANGKLILSKKNKKG